VEAPRARFSSGLTPRAFISIYFEAFDSEREMIDDRVRFFGGAPRVSCRRHARREISFVYPYCRRTSFQ